MLQVLVLRLFQEWDNIFGYNLKALGVQVQTVIAILFCKPALFVGQHFCKVEPLHLAFKSDFVQFFVDCQNIFVPAFADHLPCNDWQMRINGINCLQHNVCIRAKFLRSLKNFLYILQSVLGRKSYADVIRSD